MRMGLSLVIVIVGLIPCVIPSRQKPVYTNQFAVHVPGGKEKADALANKHGFVNMGQVSSKIQLQYSQLQYSYS